MRKPTRRITRGDRRAKTPDIPGQARLKMLFDSERLAPFYYDNSKSRFAYPKRLWRADFYWPATTEHPGVIVEYEGGVYGRGRHTRGRGYTNDCIKYNWAALHGLIVLRYTVLDLDEPARIVQDVKAALRLVDLETVDAFYKP